MLFKTHECLRIFFYKLLFVSDQNEFLQRHRRGNVSKKSLEVHSPINTEYTTRDADGSHLNGK